MNDKDYRTIDQLRQHITAGEIQQALEIIASSGANKGYLFSNSIVHAALDNPELNNELIDAAINHFISIRENKGVAHGHWVHSLSDFTPELWKKGLKSWIKRLNEISFIGANELGDNNCCNRLVKDFLRSAAWDTNPSEYGLTEENLQWMLIPSTFGGDTTNPKDGQQMLDKVKRYPFASKEEWDVAQAA